MRRLRTTPGARLGPVLVAVACAIGCHGSLTEIVVVVDSPMHVPDALDAIVLRVTGTDGTPQQGTTPLTGPDARTLPITLGLVPAGSSLGPITVEAVGQLRATTVVRREARVSFVRGEQRMLRLVLLPACAGVRCAVGQTCTETGCASIDVQGGDLPAWQGRVPHLDGGVVSDGGPPDGGPPDGGAGDGAAPDTGVADGGLFDAGPSMPDAGTCMSDVHTYTVASLCDSTTSYCIDGCTDGACVDDCLWNDPNPDCYTCADNDYLACYNMNGCQSAWDALHCCDLAHGCTDASCERTHCGTQSDAYDACTYDVPISANCDYAYEMCF